ncbi:MAG: serine/threonine protein kinase [Labilithrix sp.]|nr:serine/threonine protein kinase [Labilithrix sp.]
MPKIGDVIAAKYRLDKVAGEGGMGIVYAAEHLVLKQRVAVKVLLPDAVASDAVVERFAREARAAAKINSEHVARVLDAGSTANGSPFLVMEYLEGCDLEELLELQKTLPVRDVVDYVVQALEGLAHAHAASVVHRDLKPANLFLGCRPDGSNAIKVLDFGISKTTRSKPEDKRLTGHHVLGSPVYMSPEQLRNATDIDARADIWSIGIVAYELLSGAPPFDGDGVGEIFAAILEKEPLPLAEKDPAIPRALSDVIARCIRRDPKERWDDAGQLARALAPFGSDTTAQLADRAEQVLARAEQMRVMKTPLETRRVVDAIEAAASRAGTTGAGSGPALLLVRPKGGAATVADGVSTRIASFARRSPRRALGAAFGLLLALGVCLFGAVHATRSSAAAEAAPSPPRPTAERPDEATPPPAEGVVDEDSRTGERALDSDPPVVMELPSTPQGEKAPPRARNTKASGKPQRPKFLNSRE